jgi:hypothetical protein
MDQKDEQELKNVVTKWLKDALGPGADFSEMKIEVVADDEFYFSYIKDNKGREYKFRVFRRFDENCKLNPVVIDSSGLRIMSPKKS